MRHVLHIMCGWLFVMFFTLYLPLSVMAQGLRFLTPLGPNKTAGSDDKAPEYQQDHLPVELPFQKIEISKNGKTEFLSSYDELRELAKGEEIFLLQKRQIGELMPSPDGNHMWPSLSLNGKYVSYVVLTRSVTMWMYDFRTGQPRRIQPPNRNTQENTSASPLETRRLRLRRRVARAAGRNRIALELAWSNDSQYFMFTGGGKIYLGMPHVPSPYLLIDEGAYVASLRWSPSDDQLVYASGITGKGDLYRIQKLDDLLYRLMVEHTVNPNLEIPWLLPEQLTGKSSKAAAVEESGNPNQEVQWPLLEQLTGKSSKADMAEQWGNSNQEVQWPLPKKPTSEPSEADAVEQWGEEYFGAWHSEKLIIYQSFRGEATGFDLSRVDLGNLNASRSLISDTGDQLYPRISPDANKVSFYNTSNENDRFYLWVKDLSNAKCAPTQITSEPVLLDDLRGPLWSSDGEYLIYIADQSDEKYPIYALKYPGPDYVALTNSKTATNCTAVDLASSGKLMVYCSQVGSQQRLFVGVTNFRAREYANR